MSHPEQVGFFSAVVDANRQLLDGGRVLEIGSYNVNGTIREIFASAGHYVGVDLTEGPGVDHVGYGHEFDAPDASFDATISGECFEHDANWQKSFVNMARLTRPGGLVAFSCASRGRPEHGTRRTDVNLSPGTQSVGSDYYRNLTAREFEQVISMSSWFSTWKFWYMPTHGDLYFAGIRSGAAGAALPTDAAVASLSSMMPLPHRLARLPLTVLARTRTSEQRFQDLTYRYWQFLVRRVGDKAAR